MNLFSPSIKPGTVINRKYKIISHINSGGQAEIYKAVQCGSNKTVALKLIQKTDKDYKVKIQQLKHEALVLKQLNGNKLFLRPYAFHSSRFYTYLAMEWLHHVKDGDQYIREQHPIGWKTWLWISRRIIKGIEKCHQLGIVHHDIKPENILLTASNDIKIIDFGIAQDNGIIQLEDAERIQGTIHFIPPEQITDGEYGVPGDMYALGVTLYKFLTGNYPYNSVNSGDIMRKKTSGEFILPTRLDPDIPEWVNQFFIKLLAPSSLDRIQGCRELLAMLSLQSCSSSKDRFSSFHFCKKCNEPLWTELSFCTFCGEIYRLDITKGKYAVLVESVKNADGLCKRLEQFSKKSISPWRMHLFKGAYPRLLVKGVSKYSAHMIANAMANKECTISVMKLACGAILSNIKLSLLQIILIVCSLLFLVFLRPKSVAVIAILFSVCYTLIPLTTRSFYQALSKKRKWNLLEEIQKKVSKLTELRIRAKASTLIRQSVILYDDIQKAGVTSHLMDQVKKDLEKAICTAFLCLEQMESRYSTIKKFQKKGINKRISALERSLAATTETSLVKTMTDSLGELTKMKHHYFNILKQQGKDEIIFSEMLALLNSIRLYSDKRDFERLQKEFEKSFSRMNSVYTVN